MITLNVLIFLHLVYAIYSDYVYLKNDDNLAEAVNQAFEEVSRDMHSVHRRLEDLEGPSPAFDKDGNVIP